MKFMLLIYNDPTLLDALPEGEEDAMMRGCLAHADELKRDGRLLESRMLCETSTARSVRVRNGRTTAMDGPYAEAKEVLGGYWMIQVKSKEEAVEWTTRFLKVLGRGECEVRLVYEPTDFPPDALPCRAARP